MKAIILAAGKGTRLAGVEPDVPKPMVRLNGQPVLAGTVRWLLDHGVDEICITVGHKADVIVEYFGSIKSVWFSHEETAKEPLGTAGGIKHAVAQGQFDEPFIVWNGDNVSTCNPERMMAYHQSLRADLTMSVCWRQDAERSSIVGWSPDNRVNYFEEKPKRRVPHGWISAGMYVMSTGVASMLPDVGDIGKDVLPRLLTDAARVYAYGFGHDETLRWYDTPEDLEALRKEYEEPWITQLRSRKKAGR